MTDQKVSFTRIIGFSAILVYIIMALEVMIMISPFAFFFYSVFSPFFNFLGQHAATQWLTKFFLPHMILPPTPFLRAVRVFGSICFVVGLVTFCLCAVQVYLGKIFKWGIAAKGLYRSIRHPQYLALAIWGIGMAILWPRFIVLASLTLMFVLYYFLALDEERRMLGQYGDSYRRYMDATGMFLPGPVEKPFATLLARLMPAPAWRHLAIPVLLAAVIMGTGVLLRQITLSSLPMVTRENLTLLSILPEDSHWEMDLGRSIIAAARDGAVPFLRGDNQYLGYVMPPDYIMQGMIADTGGHSHLFKHHHTVALITDWVFHPFEHLRRPPAAHMAALHHVDPVLARRHHCPVGLDQPDMDCATCPIKRVILLEVVTPAGQAVSSQHVLGLGTVRKPVGFVDLDAATGKILHTREVPRGTAWKAVPTPDI